MVEGAEWEKAGDVPGMFPSLIVESILTVNRGSLLQIRGKELPDPQS